ncbi:MAG: GNAT family N-acetyltransferase [Blautia faecis]
MTVLPIGKKQLRDKYYVGFFGKESLIAVMDLISDYPEEGCGFIGLFMMDVDYQNRGIGSYIVDNVLGYCKIE